MKKIILVSTVLLGAVAACQAGVGVSVHIGLPLPSIVIGRAPAVVVTPPPVYTVPPPVVVYRAPVVVAPAPRFVYRVPRAVIVAPPPAVIVRPPGFGFGFHLGRNYHHHDRWEHRYDGGWDRHRGGGRR